MRLAIAGSINFDEWVHLRDVLDGYLLDCQTVRDELIIATTNDVGAAKMAIKWAAKRGVISHLYVSDDVNGTILKTVMRDQKLIMGSEEVLYFLHEGQNKKTIEFPLNFARGMGRKIIFL